MGSVFEGADMVFAAETEKARGKLALAEVRAR